MDARADQGLGIAFRAKPVVRQNARQAISTPGLDGILYVLGVRDPEAFDHQLAGYREADLRIDAA